MGICQVDLGGDHERLGCEGGVLARVRSRTVRVCVDDGQWGSRSARRVSRVPRMRMQLNISSVYLEGSAQYTIGMRTSPPVMPMVVMPLPPLPPMPCAMAPYPSLPFTYSSGLGPRAISMEVNSMSRMGQHVGPIRATSLPQAPRPRAASMWKEMIGESGPLGVINERGVRVPHSK